MPSAVIAAAATGPWGLVGLGPGRYFLGCLVLVVALAAMGAAAVAIRRVVVPWRGAPARLVEVTVGLSLVTAIAFTVGAVGRFSGGWLFGAIVGVAAVAIIVAGRIGPRPFALADGPTVPSPRWEWVGAGAALAIVGAQWVSHTAWALGHGMTEGDTLWYHGVFAARFVQEGRLDILPDLGGAAQGFFPANSQMFHALGFFPFDRDLVSPLLNLALASIAVLAAYCAGRRRGLGALTVTGAAVVIGLPGIVGTHPGQATNDFLCATFLLLALALLIEGGIEPLPLALGGLAAALALGTKLTVALPIAVLTLAVVVVAIRRRRIALVIAWLVPLVGLGAFWFVRNWALVDNPLPFYDLRFGPLHFPVRQVLADDASVADHLFESDTWSRVFRPGLWQAFGPAWPVIVAAPGIAGLLAVGRGRTTAERVVGVGAFATGVGYVFTPFTMELGGAAFAATARYAAPALLVGMVLLPIAVRLDAGSAAWRIVALVVGVGVVVVNATRPNVDRFAPWRIADRPLAIVIVLVVLAALLIASLVDSRGKRLVAAAMVLAVVAGGFMVQRHYLERRYTVGAGLRLDPIYERVSADQPASIAPFSTIQFYPFFGPAFANRVVVFVPPITADDRRDRCREWERAIRRRGIERIVVSPDFVPGAEAPDPAWFRGASGLDVLVRDRRNRLYAVDGPVRLACPSP